MRTVHAGLVLAALAGLGATGPAAIGHAATQGRSLALAAARPGELPPAAWLQADPADSLYRAARTALTRGRYQQAAELFHQIGERYPASGYAADALYWEAFARYRLGGQRNLREARTLLERQTRDFPEAATQGDAAALATRIRGELARQGDAQAAAELQEQVGAIAPPAAPATPAAPASPAPVAAPATPAAPMAGPTGRTPRPPRAPRAPRLREAGDRACDDEDDVKLAALNAVLQMDAERAMPILQRVLARRDSASVCLRRKAVFLVSQKATPATESTLLDVARNDPDREVRGQAIFWLSQVGTERATTALDSILRSSTDPAVQEKALFALSQQSNPRATTALRAFAERNDIDEEMRGKAIFWLGQSNSADNAQFLRGLFGRLKSEELKKRVLFSISQMRDPGAQRWLLDVARERAQPIEIRKNALFWAGQSGKIPVADLATLYGTMDDREMKEQLIFVLSQRDEPAALDKLMDIARRDPDPELRKKALFWVGQSNDPRAAQLLQDILESK
ncbi:MAG TPA: HEAT repeat domain-containing protein [Gemmatimonadales bacterium]|nr:HEAT repeat domain-containing protein [Gemmatimonadales bacterium]